MIPTLLERRESQHRRTPLTVVPELVLELELVFTHDLPERR